MGGSGAYESELFRSLAIQPASSVFPMVEVLENLFARYVLDLELWSFEEMVIEIPDEILGDGNAFVGSSFSNRVPS